MSIFELIKEPTGGVTIIENGQDSFFGPAFSPHLKVNGTTVSLKIADCEFKISTTDDLSIDVGSGLNQFIGSAQELKTALIPLFPKANPSSGGSGEIPVAEFTPEEKVIIRQIIQSYKS
jgi:hypothetical protein